MPYPKPRSPSARPLTRSRASARPSRRAIFSLTRALATAALPLCAWASGCGNVAEVAIDNPLAQGGAIVAVPRPVDSTTLGTRRAALKIAGAPDINEVGTGEDFLLAIRKDELANGSKWFVSAFMKQVYPNGVAGGAASSLGIRVVSFRQQNGKLFMIDASDNNKVSDYYDPTVLVDAYPIITDYDVFQRMPGATDYVLIDPSAGLNKFDIMSDAYAGGSEPGRFNVELSYMQRFRKVDDGVTFERVLTGFSDQGDGTAAGQGESQPFRISGVLGLSLRRYSEGAGFKRTTFLDRNDPMGQTEIPELYFRTDPHPIPNTGVTEDYAVHFNPTPGKPITWVISANVDRVQNATVLAKDANGDYKPTKIYGDYDLYGAIAKGITNWNSVFGFEAFKVRKATAADSPGDDDTNFIYVDEDESLGFAFANWRHNPNNGEVRGASVYFNSIWLSYADGNFEADLQKPPEGAKDLDVQDPYKMQELRKQYWAQQQAKRKKVPRLSWRPFTKTSEPLCTMLAPNLRPGWQHRPGPKGGAQLTLKQKVEQYVTHVVLHEVGHTLGLRHNFKGSLKWGPKDTDAKTSSVMEYVYDPDAIFAPVPQSHDIAAVRYLYQLDNKLPTDPFCTDDGIDSLNPTDADCAPFDQTDNPLEKYHAPFYIEDLKNYLETDDFIAYIYLFLFGEGNPIVEYVKGGATAAQRNKAFDILWGEAKLPIPANKEAMFPGYNARAGDIASLLLPYLLSPPDPNERYPISISDPVQVAFVVDQARQNLLINDGTRSYALKRFLVVQLKRIQRSDALSALVAVRNDLQARIPGLTGTEKANSVDLLNRVNQALSPYFN